ncbi:HEPN domain-containing protein [Rheinheimera sp. 1928-s]|uniref:HEPN domain-containing protein n=1 Tax=Rheinheimera sp. 1928-s TaxID=3033803 RepID=UPI002613A5B1|nr:HEPN domain-containing protein [Rheinheimera sp. 1928-s]MDF3125062.1 HEPN domain-containing protein [Rheinheimera sp. 1928-s]
MASTSYQAFETAIADAEPLLVPWLPKTDKQPKPEQQTNEVLKRAALTMTLTAWETYIEAWLNEQLCQKISILKGWFASACGSIKGIHKKFTESVNQLNNPNSHKVRQLSMEFLQSDITGHRLWNNFDKPAVCTQLNKYLTLRDEVVYKGRNNADPKVPHLVKRDEVEKAIKFFKELVKVTDCVAL